MTRDEARQLLPIIQAYSEGKAVEWQDAAGVWYEDHVPAFDYAADRYRIKPEPIECWAVVDPIGFVRRTCPTRTVAEEMAKDFHYRVIRMREVSE